MKKLLTTLSVALLTLGMNAQQGIFMSAGQLGHNVAQVESENTNTIVSWKKSNDTTVFAYGQYKVDVTTEPGVYYELEARSREYDNCGDLLLDTTYVMSVGQGNNYPTANIYMQCPKFIQPYSLDTLRAMASWVLTQPGDSVSAFWWLPSGKKIYGFECPLKMDTSKSRFGTYNFMIQIWRQNVSGVGSYVVGEIYKSVHLRNKTKLFAPWSDRTFLLPNTSDSVLLVAEPGYQKYVWFKDDSISVPKLNNDSIWVKTPGDYKYTGTFNGTKFRSGVCSVVSLGCPLKISRVKNTPEILHDQNLLVVDMKGSRIYYGKKENFNFENLPHGLYLLTQNGKSEKIFKE